MKGYFKMSEIRTVIANTAQIQFCTGRQCALCNSYEFDLPEGGPDMVRLIDGAFWICPACVSDLKYVISKNRI